MNNPNKTYVSFVRSSECEGSLVFRPPLSAEHERNLSDAYPEFTVLTIVDEEDPSHSGTIVRPPQQEGRTEQQLTVTINGIITVALQIGIDLVVVDGEQNK